MSRINGLPGPHAPVVPASTTRPVSGPGFASRVQATASGAAGPSPAPSAAVPGRAVVSSAIAAARQESAASSGTAAAPPDAAQQQKLAVQEMSRSFLMGTMQSIFAGIGEAGPKAPQDD
ncbi:hypothetical protein [Archangium primigenium]|uniref:hypothetical protein n=1 Tax=[Archangium] primigenium TaxID=2792470 RepID=UPI00195B1164|nr:hypothetical protein [Archangium primigenium]MBM7115217.1 hypothetical protein [Archangium primigenium]